MCSLEWNLSSRVAEVWMLYSWGCHSGWFVAAGPWKSGRLASPIITIVINKNNHSLKEQKWRWFSFFRGPAPTGAPYKPSAVKCAFKNSINLAFSLELQKLRGDDSSIRVIPPSCWWGNQKERCRTERFMYIRGAYFSQIWKNRSPLRKTAWKIGMNKPFVGRVPFGSFGSVTVPVYRYFFARKSRLFPP